MPFEINSTDKFFYMVHNMDDSELVIKWVKNLQNEICRAYEAIEMEYRGEGDAGKFEKKQWDRDGGGGGEMRVMRGRVFEKVGVNVSTVFGKLSPEFMKEIPGTETSPDFFACGISLVTHMKSPMVPTIHMNTRYMKTSGHWFGGGIDLTPTVEYDDDTYYFHAELKKMCDNHDKTYYEKFKKECDEYFYIKHWKEPRGVGGIFYDKLNTGSFEKDFDFMKDVGRTFLEVSPAIVRKRLGEKWAEKEKAMQMKKRAKYAEFNLAYDRGTRFGFMTGGNPEAILVSLPPVVQW